MQTSNTTAQPYTRGLYKPPGEPVKIKAGSSVEQFRYAKSMHLMLTAEQFWIGISTTVQRQAIQIGKPKCRDEFMLPHHEPKKSKLMLLHPKTPQQLQLFM